MSRQLLKRKSDHLRLALKSRVSLSELDDRFNYEPLFSPHPEEFCLEKFFLGKKINAPIWISSMTGGNKGAELINKNLAEAANFFGLGMALGSCRALFESKKNFSSFNLRPIIGENLPFFANLGVAQIEKMLEVHAEEKILSMIDSLNADGLIIHVNPLQEWLQPEGDRFKRPALETIEEFLEKTKIKTIVKEVGQGFGPKSLSSLIKLPLAALELSGFGGTNFSKLECLRSSKKANFYNPLAYVGHSAQEMVQTLLEELKKLGDKVQTKEFIVSGGVMNFTDGHYLMLKLKEVEISSVYGQAGEILKRAQKGKKELFSFFEAEIEGLKVAQTFLSLKK